MLSRRCVCVSWIRPAWIFQRLRSSPRVTQGGVPGAGQNKRQRPGTAGRPAPTRRENGVILVTGATGRVGYRLMEALADAGADATAMVRVEARAADLPGAPGHVVASFDDPPSAEILRRFDRVFLLSPVHEEQAAMETVFIDALAAASHRPHIVKIAADGFQDPDCEVRFMRSHRQVSMHLDA